MTRFFTFLLLLQAFRCASPAQTLTWMDLSGLNGYALVTRTGTGTLFATNYRGVVDQSTDGGTSFNTILAYTSSTGILDLALNGDHAAARIRVPGVGSPYQILVWNGAPNDWTRILATSSSFYQALMLNDSGIVFGIDPFNSGRIVRYSGTSWAQIGTRQSFLTGQFFNGDLRVVTAVDHSNDIIVGSLTGGVYVSHDYAQTWSSSLTSYPVSAVNVTIPGTILVGATPSPTPPLNTFGGVFSSTDGGVNWRGLGLSNHTITTLAAGGPGTIYALADGGAYRHDNSTGGWVLISPAGRQFTSIALTGPGSILLSSEAAGIYRTTDDGATWSGSDIRGKDVFAVTALPTGELLAGTLGSGIFRSLPGEQGWTQLADGATGPYVYSFAQSGGSLYAATNFGVYKTNDVGQSWLNSTSGALSGSAYAVEASADGTLLAGTGFGVYRSSDAGTSWTQSGLQNSTVFYLSAAGDGTVYAGTSKDGVFASTNGGLTWSLRGLVRNDIQALIANSAGDLFAGVYGGVVRSTDQGTTWLSANFVSGYAYCLVAPAPQTLFAGTLNGIFRSSDEGATWSPAGDSGLSQSLVLSLAVDPENHLLAGTYRGTVYRSVNAAAPPVVSGVPPLLTLPSSTELSQNYPNPFNPRTEIRFQIAGGPAYVNLRVFNLSGEEVAVLVDGKKGAGTYTVPWNGGNRPSGVYLCQLRVKPLSSGGTYISSKKMLLLR
jgi:hypothetical protein